MNQLAADEGAILETLMLAYQNGDPSAFEKLYSMLKPRVLRFTLSQVWTQARAEDLLQETFLQVHRSRRTYIPGRPVLPWVYAIARNVCLMDRRTRARRDRHEDLVADVPTELAATMVSDGADLDLIQKAMAMVPRERVEVLLMHHVCGLSFVEIAAALGIRVTTAKVRAHRGLRSLREAMKRLGVTRSGFGAN
jgi:RNA polymerase sigma-70 factor (ECF subfamily)